LTDEVRGFREERDDAEAQLESQGEAIEDLKGALHRMAAELQSVRGELATARASVSWQQSRLP
jgi:chromosome segregation ATPase